MDSIFTQQIYMRKTIRFCLKSQIKYTTILVYYDLRVESNAKGISTQISEIIFSNQ